MKRSNSAFTFVELLIVIAIIAVLVAIQLPATANTKAKVQLVNCSDNLKRISVAFRAWSSSHNDRMPMSTPSIQGGASEAVGARATSLSFLSNFSPTRRGVFGIFVVMSNELATPKILYCPSEYRTNIAQGTIFGNTTLTNTGFYNDNGTSYFVGVDASDFSPNMLLTGDHSLGDASNPPATPNIYGDTKSNFISAGTNAVWSASSIGWANNQHQKQGNVNFADGSVQNLDTTQFREALNKSGDFSRFSGIFILPLGSVGSGINRLQFP